MNQFVCEHPKKVRNPYTNEVLFVPCGNCDMCRSAKAAHWTERLEMERSCHPYCLFGTLTYSDKFLPRCVVSDDGFLDDRTGELIPFDDLNYFLDYDSIEFINSCGCLPCGNVEDVQKFIKRLRSKISSGRCRDLARSEDRPESRYIRYFLVEELGETTFRPHYHFIIFTASKWFAENAKTIVDSCWTTDDRSSNSEQLGITDVQNVQTSASAYVSSYINSFVDCPRIYKDPRFRPFKIFSKHPPLGSLLSSSPEVRSLFESGAVTMFVYRRKSNKFVEVPIPKDLCNRLYPKVTGFDRFSPDVLSGLYLSDVDFSQMSYEDFREFVRRRGQKLDIGVASGINDYCSYLLKTSTESESNIHYTFSCLRRLTFQAQIFNVSKSLYFKKICEFYKSQDYFRLKSFFEYYADPSNKVDAKEMLLADPLVFKQLQDGGLFSVDFLKTYGYDEKTCSTQDFIDSISMENDINFINARSKAKKIVNDSRKKKAKNEYLEFRSMSSNFRNYLIKKHGFSKHYEGACESVTFS